MQVPLTKRFLWTLYIVNLEIHTLLQLRFVEAGNIPTMKQQYGVCSPVAFDILLSTLDLLHIALDY